MSNYEAISKSLHKGKYWKPFSNYEFAAQDSVCPIVALEVPKAVLHLPIAFTKLEDRLELCAVLGFGAGNSCVVDSAGQWLAGYIPAFYRGDPFALATTQEDKQTLCIKTDSISDYEGEEIFDDMGEPSDQIQKIIDFLSGIARNAEATHAICKVLEKLDLLEPWPIIIRNGESEKTIEGLIRINEEKFNSLTADAFLDLREEGALSLIFLQLLSMQNLHKITQLVKSDETQAVLPEELPFDFSGDHGNISFDGLF
jgi:hypothetical protein